MSLLSDTSLGLLELRYSENILAGVRNLISINRASLEISFDRKAFDFDKLG